MTTTVNQVLRIAEDLKQLADEERQIMLALDGSTAKADRLNADLTRVRSRITTKKQALKTAAADME